MDPYPNFHFDSDLDPVPCQSYEICNTATDHVRFLGEHPHGSTPFLACTVQLPAFQRCGSGSDFSNESYYSGPDPQH